MTVKRNEPTREAECFYDDNGKPHYRSTLSPKSVKVRAECKRPLHYPGIILFVHGVNSTGEWYATAEEELCKGLNKRLGLADTPFALIPADYSCDNTFDFARYKKARQLLNPGKEKSPVIRFYWGYRAPDGEEDKYKIPLVNIHNEDYHRLKEQGTTDEALRTKGPWFWGGGPFQNGTNQLVSLWGESGFDETLHPFELKVQQFAPDFDRLLTSAPPRHYYAHAAKRLADLLDSIRKKYPRDTVSVISHSQGTMVALAATALAQQAPDSLFILNSPYTMETKLTDSITLPEKEVLSDRAREQTLSAIIDKIAERANTMTPADYDSLCVGQSAEQKRWRPDITHQSAVPHTTISYSKTPEYVDSGQDYPKAELKQETTETTTDRWIPERDNHGRVYIYCNPHDRVMGSSPLLSLGWQGLPNVGFSQAPHPLLKKHNGFLFQRMLARATPCGGPPNAKTAFSPLPDGKLFWDDGGDFLTYHQPGYQTLNINAEEVPEPIPASAMAEFDQSRDGDINDKNPESREGRGWGQSSEQEDKMTQQTVIAPNDDTFENYLSLYPKIAVPTGGYRASGQDYPRSVPIMRQETDAERRIRVGKYISQPTDHSTLPKHPKFISQVVAFDLPVGFCDATWDKAFIAELRLRADWTKGGDDYFNSGQLSIPPIPAIISTETPGDKKRSDIDESNKKRNALGMPSGSTY